ncbi:MAG: DMT family transporter [Bdellovibrionales bacterium]|nr:DMT family transporter [Bdellovibrionales bacterium]
MVRILGWAAVALSAFSFYFDTVVVSRTRAMLPVPAEAFVLSRFVIGLTVVSAFFLIRRRVPRPVRHAALLLRGIGNAAAVICLFRAASLGPTAQANILNLTYPLFVALFTYIFVPAERDYQGFALTAVAVGAMLLVVSPAEFATDLSALYGLLSGVFASLAILALSFARRGNDTETVLLVMFATGAVVCLPLVPYPFPWFAAPYFLLSAAFGISGQVLLTYGFRYVSAVEGSILSSSRIVIAAVLGPLVASEPSLDATGWIGAMTLFAINCWLAVRKGRSGVDFAGSSRNPVVQPSDQHV